MTDKPIGYCAVSKPTIWRRLGWGVAHGYHAIVDWRTEDPDVDDWWTPGAVVTDTVVQLDFLDRLRLLITGRLRVEVSTRTDAAVRRSESRSSVTIEEPR